ncbi:MAG: hypothetical protein JW860_14675 [Sedimentisphaerales bacterium]|nr:hypothetical protein [Sedimentisphaerales bacterium]
MAIRKKIQNSGASGQNTEEYLSSVSSKIFFLVIIFGIVLIPLNVKAYTFVQIGVDSNFLIHKGQVYFAQADGSLTVLDVITGNVIARKKDREYSGTIKKVDGGILILGTQITLLDDVTFKTAWEADLHFTPEIIDNYLVSYDANGFVQCRKIDNGQICWSIHIDGALDIVAEKDYVLVHRSAWNQKDPVMVLLFELETGKELFRKSSPEGIHYGNVYFDGEKIYIEAGSFTESRWDALFEKMIVWNLSGEEVSFLDVSSDIDKRRLSSETPFTLGDKTFAQGRVWGNPDNIPPKLEGECVKYSSSDQDDKYISCYTYKIEDGYVNIDKVTIRSDTDWECHNFIKLKTDNANWEGELTYLKDNGRISVITQADNYLLLGSNLGEVECIDILTGKSLWIYIFPTIRHTMSFSSYGMPPYMDKAAEIYRKENARVNNISGMQLLSSDVEKTSPIIIYDPEPTNPFLKLPLYRAITWAAALAPLLILVVTWKISPNRHWRHPLSVITCLILYVFTVSCLLIYGRISLSSSIAMRLTILILFIYLSISTVKAFIEIRSNFKIVIFMSCVFGIALGVFTAFFSMLYHF